MRPEPAEAILTCAACKRYVRLVYVPGDAEPLMTWRCPARQCHADNTLDRRGRLIKVFMGVHEPEYR
jgi:hypothetical protein